MAGRNIPNAVKRQVRKECFFGCVICGCPIYHYDHIIPYSEVKAHKPSNLALLCPNHHQDKTSGRLPIEIVEDRRNHPINKEWVESSPHELFFVGDDFYFQVGSNVYGLNLTASESAYQKYKILTLEDAELITCKIIRRNQNFFLLPTICSLDRSGKRLFAIRDGEISVGTYNWDVTFSGNVLKINSAPKIISTHISFFKNAISLDYAEFSHKTDHIVIRPTYWTLNGIQQWFNGNSYLNSIHGLAISRKLNQRAALTIWNPY